MKKFLSFLLILLAGIAVVMAQTPWKMSYQAVVRDANNWLVPNQTIGVKLSVLQDSINGMPVFAEYHTAQTNANALVSLQIGTGTPLMAYTLADVDWGNHNFFLKSEIDPMGGTNYTISGVQPLIAVPYAFHALAADNADSATFATNADNANNAINANTANVANLANVAYTALHSDTTTLAVHAVNADTAQYALNANAANNSNHANYSDTALYSANANHSNYSDTATYAANGTHSVYSDTAQFAHNATHSDTALYAYSVAHSDTTQFAYTAAHADSSANAIYSDTAQYAHNAGSSVNAINATYADSSVYANTSVTALYADSSDFNHLANRPTGTNTGDMLYWQTNDNSWHVTPVGTSGQVLQLDTNKVPAWNNVSGLAYNLATVYTNAVTNYTGYTATVTGYVSNDGNSPFVFSGFCWSTSPNPTLSNNYSLDGVGTTSFSHQITGLNIGTTYHVRAYAVNNAGTAYGADQSFKTWNYPTVTTNSTVTTISATTAYCGGDVTDDGGTSIYQRGVCWNTWGSPTIYDNITYDGTGLGQFSSYMTGLAWGTTYYVRAYATNAIDTKYGAQISFTTLNQPTVTTNYITDIDTTSAVSGGNVTADGGDLVTARGIVWNTWGYPDIYSYTGKTTNGSGLGSFVDTMKNLTPGQTYYVRAYATNSISTAYGSQYTFSANPVKPTVTTTHPSNISTYSVTGGGNVTSNGGAYVSQRGVCYTTTGVPTIYNSTVSNGSGNGSYSCNINSLSPGTTYYIRAYATNSVGTSYGAVDSFKTLITYPTVTTNPISNTATYSAVSGGNVTADGGDSVTARGIVWRIGSWPTVSNYTGIDTSGAGLGTFTDTMTGLLNATTYYVKAWARNSFGATVSSSGYSFTTLPAPPTVATSATVTNVLGSSATSGGTISSDGGSTITNYGVCWDTVPNPVLGTNNYTANSWYYYNSIPYQYSSSCSNLLDSTTYWVCAYATNSYGTTYGTAVSFTTKKLPTVVTDNITNIGVSFAASGVQVLADGGEMIQTCGICWDTISTPTINSMKTTIPVGDNAPQAFYSLAQNLKDSTIYYVRAYATTSVGTGYGQTISLTTLALKPCPGLPTVSDTDGNVYNTIQIGNQCWMRENLRTTRYADGKLISDGAGSTSTKVALKFYPGGNISNVPTYGYLYNWPAVMYADSSSAKNPSGVQGICPNGWHVPSNLEWTILENYVSSQVSCQCDGSSTWISKALASQTGWNSNSTNCTPGNNNSSISNNITGFSAKAAGYNTNGNINSSSGFKNYALLWSCTESGTSAYGRMISGNDYPYVWNTMNWGWNAKYYGASVRCIKNDNSVADGMPCPGSSTVTDNDNNIYNTVLIGTQCWMKENLRTTTYPNGTQITYGQTLSPNTSSTVGYYYHVQAYQPYDVTYGLLYNWIAAMNGSTSSSAMPSGVQGICPNGWHLPSPSEWNQLINYVKSGQYLCNNNSYSGKPLASDNNWTSYNYTTCSVGEDITTNNASGFSAQPAGYKNSYNTYYSSFGTEARFWSSMEKNDNILSAYNFYLTYSDRNMNNTYDGKATGYSVRCLKD